MNQREKCENREKSTKKEGWRNASREAEMLPNRSIVFTWMNFFPETLESRRMRLFSEVLLSQLTMQTDGGTTTYLVGCIASRHMSPVSFCPEGRTCLTEFVPGRPAQTPSGHEPLSDQLPDMDEVYSAQMIPGGPRLLSFVICGITYSTAKISHNFKGEPFLN